MKPTPQLLRPVSLRIGYAPAVQTVILSIDANEWEFSNADCLDLANELIRAVTICRQEGGQKPQ
jgi:hypothetical protein